MIRGLIVRSDAESDITDAARWYENQEAGLGTEFVDEIRNAISQLTVRPLSYLRIRKSPAVHRILVRRFPYRVFYIVRPDAIVVFAVLHAARHDRRWGWRIKDLM